MKNQNQELIKDLRKVADWLDEHPDIPKMYATAGYSIFNKDELKTLARKLGSFKKEFSDYYFTLVKSFGSLDLRFHIGREQVCKKLITWDCNDDATLLALVSINENTEVL